MNTLLPATITVRAAGLDTMLVIKGVSLKRVVATLQNLRPSCSEGLFYGALSALMQAGASAILATDELHANSDYLLRVDEEKILVRETTPAFVFAPGWGQKVAPMAAIYPMGQGVAGPFWVKGDPSAKSLDALEKFIEANPGLGTAFSTALKQAVGIARGSR